MDEVSTVARALYRFDYWLSDHRPVKRAWRCHVQTVTFVDKIGPGANRTYESTGSLSKDFYGGSYDSVNRQAKRWQKRHTHHARQERKFETLMATDEVAIELLPSGSGEEGDDGGNKHGS